MERLAMDQRKSNGLILGEWEAEFLACFQRSRVPHLWFTAGRRRATDRMWMKLGPDLGLPHPLDTVHEAPKLADADPAGCEYLVRGEDGRQRRCNEPACWQGERRGPRPGLRYCKPHKESVERAFKGAIFTALGSI